MHYIKSEIYKLFDKEGISVRPMSQTSMLLDQDKGFSEITEKNVYIPILDKFDISESDFKQLVVDYIYDTTSINIVSIDNLDKYPSVNGLPFLLKLEDNLNNEITFS